MIGAYEILGWRRTGRGGHVLHVVLQNLHAAADVRKRDRYVLVETAGSNEGTVNIMVRPSDTRRP